MKNLLRVSEQTSWQVIGKVLTSLSTIIILFFISRQFNEAGVGIFTLALTYLSFFYLANDAGLNIFCLPHLQNSGKSYFNKLLGVRIVWALILSAVALLLLPFLPFATPDFKIATTLAVLTIIFSSIFVSTNAIFQSKLRYDLSVLASLVGTLTTLITILLLVGWVHSVVFLTLGNLVGWVITSTAALIFIKKLNFNILPEFDLSFFKEAAAKNWPISATLILNVVYFRLDAFVISTFRSFAEVGVYNLAFLIFQTLLVVPAFIMNSFYPIMLNTLKTNSRLFLRQIKIAFLGLCLISTPAVLLTWLLAPMAIRVLAGTGFAGSVTSLKILSLGFPAFFLSSLLMWTLISYAKYKQVLVIYLIGLIVNSILNFIFVPQYSYIASSVITGISEYLILVLQFVILIPIIRRYHGFSRVDSS